MGAVVGGAYVYGGRDGKLFAFDVALGLAAGIALVQGGPQQSAMFITGAVESAKQGTIPGIPEITDQEADALVTSGMLSAITAGSGGVIDIVANRIGVFIKGSERLSQEGVENAVTKSTTRAGKIATSSTANGGVKTTAGKVVGKEGEIINGVRSGASTAYKTFNLNNIRYNLTIKTGFNGRDAANNVTHHAHHIFIQKHEAIFQKAGINIHDPRYLAWWEASSHLSHAAAYESKWDLFIEPYIRTNTTPSKELILRKGREFMGSYGLQLYY